MYERIRALREDKDLSQREIADKCHISQRTYSHYENGDRAIPTEILCRLAELHETSVDYLLDRTDEKKPYKKRRRNDL